MINFAPASDSAFRAATRPGIFQAQTNPPNLWITSWETSSDMAIPSQNKGIQGFAQILGNQLNL
jgi:hypothetical protein